jgi:riboflavin kinase/FMN adenylyltransferase
VTLWRGLDAVVRDVGATPRRRSVITVGVFDGVHRGHQVIVAEVVRRARALDVPAVAVTFDPHPLALLRPDKAPAMLTTIDRRAELLGEVGIDHVVVLNFDRELSEQSPREFVEVTLFGGLHASEIVVGADFRFGYQAAGDVALLTELGDELGFAVEGVGLVGDGRERWSSTAVRRRLADGEAAGAASILGRPHRVDGLVVHGDHRGRTLGFPTANVLVEASIAVPGDGVYAGRLSLLDDEGRTGTTYDAAISVGANTTFEGTERRVEAHCLGAPDLQLYDRRVGIEFVDRIRPMRTFDGVEALVAQVRDDIAVASRILGENEAATGRTPAR